MNSRFISFSNIAQYRLVVFAQNRGGGLIAAVQATDAKATTLEADFAEVRMVDSFEVSTMLYLRILVEVG